MKLRNKKTGLIMSWYNETNSLWPDTLKELTEEWEDYEEPKDFQYIMADGNIDLQSDNNSIFSNNLKAIGNYFETKEEAEKAVEKLKAWKRLRDNGLRFYHYEIYPKRAFARVEVRAKRGPVLAEQAAQFVEDLDLIFGGKK